MVGASASANLKFAKVMETPVSPHSALFILGASGRTGGHLVDLALARGHHVTAFVRSPQKITRRAERLTVVAGDPRRANELGRALPGHDAVISALGSSTLGPTTVLGDCARSMVESMRIRGVKRLFVTSSALLFPDAGLVAVVLRSLVFKNVMRDSERMEEIVKNSGLDWTIVRPVRLTNGPLTKLWRFEDRHIPRGGSSVSRVDVADFILDAVEKDAHIHKIIGVSR